MYSPSQFSLDKIAFYREGNHLEVKSARGGLPHSLWESYSAFANSEGGIIVLGISERAGSGLQGIYKTWAAVYHTEPRMEVSSMGIDRTTLYLDFGENQPDIQAMLRLYDNVDGIVIKEEYTESSPVEGASSPVEGESAPKSSPKTYVSSPVEGESSPIEGSSSPDDPEIIKLISLSGFIESSSDEKVIMLLRINSKLSLSMIGVYLGMTKRGVQKITNRLKKQGILRYVGLGKSGEWVITDVK